MGPAWSAMRSGQSVKSAKCPSLWRPMGSAPHATASAVTCARGLDQQTAPSEELLAMLHGCPGCLWDARAACGDARAACGRGGNQRTRPGCRCREAESADEDGQEAMLFLKGGACEVCPSLFNPFNGPCRECQGSKCTRCNDGHYLDAAGACQREGGGWAWRAAALGALCMHAGTRSRGAHPLPSVAAPRQPARKSCARCALRMSAWSVLNPCMTPMGRCQTMQCSRTARASARGEARGTGGC